jgi:toll-like receptor 13
MDDDIKCDCSARGLKGIPRDCPGNTTQLIMTGNNLYLLDNDAFINFPKLQYLNVENCNISKTGQTPFTKLDLLRELNIKKNPLSAFQWNILKPLVTLQTLRISHDLLATYPEQSWIDLSNITHVFTIEGPTEMFGNVFTAMESLIYLNHGKDSSCDIRILYNFTFEAFTNISIKTLIFAPSCQIYSVELDAFLPLQSVSKFSISRQGKMLMSNMLPAFHVFKDHKMEEINLSGDFRSHGEFIITPRLFSYIGDICVKSIILSDNAIKLIEGDALLNMKYKTCLENLDLSYNEFDYQGWLVITLFVLFNNLKSINFSGKFVVSKEFTMIGKSIALNLPNSLEYADISYLGNIRDSGNSINVSANNLQFLDLAGSYFFDCNYKWYGLHNVKVLNFFDSKCSSIDSSFLSTFKNVERLVMKKASLGIGLIGSDKQGAFLRGLRSLQYIELSNNKFTEPFTNEMFSDQFDSLLSLVIDNNLFNHIPVILSNFRKLHRIDLRNNKIHILTQVEIEDIENLNKKMHSKKLHLFLNGNPILCNCDSLHFIEWIFSTTVLFDREGNYPCLYTDGSYKTTRQVFEQIEDIKIKCVSQLWLILGVTFSSVLILVVILSSVAYRYRVSLQYCCLVTRGIYRHYRKLDGDSKEYQYDAFVAYSADDYKWVYGPLQTYLEKNQGFKLGLHERDFEAGKYIADNIIDVINRSKKIIFVISSSFLKSDWGQYELDMARMHMFQQNREMLIVIILEDMSISRMPARLKQIWESITCLEADDIVRGCSNPDSSHTFWKRLNQAMSV